MVAAIKEKQTDKTVTISMVTIVTLKANNCLLLNKRLSLSLHSHEISNPHLFHWKFVHFRKIVQS